MMGLGVEIIEGDGAAWAVDFVPARNVGDHAGEVGGRNLPHRAGDRPESRCG